MKQKKISVSEMALIAVMAAVTCIMGPLSIPIPFSVVPISLTNLAVYLAIYVLGCRRGTLSYLVYLLLGLVGVPVFSGFSGGVGKLFGPTGGYIIGFLVTAVFLAYFKGEKYNFKRYALLGCVIGIPLIYVFGVVQLKLITGMGWDKAIMTGALPFIPLDIVKCLAAAVIAGPINRIFANNR